MSEVEVTALASVGPVISGQIDFRPASTYGWKAQH